MTPINENVDIILNGYSSFYFEEEHCKAFYKGYAFSETETEKWIKLLVTKLNHDKTGFNTFLASELADIKGLFTLIIMNGSDYYIATDIIRSFPVFYGFNNNLLFITSDLDKYQKQNNPLPIDYNKLEEFTTSGFVYGNGTIFKNVYALQAGEFVSIISNNLQSYRYFKYKPVYKPVNFDSLSEFTQIFDKVLRSVFNRMINQTPMVNHWIVPLSGGHDSRIIVNYLYRLGIKNVVCFSYGMPDNEQSGLSKQVAEALGFEWHFVEYTEQKWQNLHESGLFDEYIMYAFNGVSTPHLQDFLAVYELKKKQLIKQGDVFVTGHTFDFLVGSNLQNSDIVCDNENMAVERTFLMHSKMKSWSLPPVRTIEDIYENAKVDPKHFQEYFNWQEKRAKFMVNSSKGYEFFGFESRLPFWDKEIVDFWLTIPDNERMERKIFFKAEKQGILVDQLSSIPFFGKSDRASHYILEDILRKLLPDFVKTMILRFTCHKVNYNAGINLIYSLKASTLKELLDPVENFPAQIRPYFKAFLNRYPYQIDPYFLTGLYTIRKQFDRNKNL